MAAPAALVVDLSAPPAWSDFDIPDGSAPVRTARLGERTLLVAFPSGWERVEGGTYEAAEEMVVLDGELRMSGETYTALDWAWFPAGCLRRETRARTAVLALARFFGPARWAASDRAGPASSRRHLGDRPGAADFASPLGAGRAWMLHSGVEATSFLVEALETGTPSPAGAELLDLAGRRWAWVPAGAPLPAFSGACFCRIVTSEDARGGPR